MRYTYLLLPILFLGLTACGDSENTEESTEADVIVEDRVARPSEAMGIFASTYLSQGAFINVQSAILGIETQMKINAGQQIPATDETFSLLRDLGTILQIDFVDEMNRSTNRTETLDQYIKSLKGVGQIADRKRKELEAKVGTLKEDRKVQKKESSNLEREVKNLLRDEDYARAGDKQQEVTKASSQLSETESLLEQTEDILERFESLLEITKERIFAIQSNREVLIAGVKVREVPGIEDLDILDDTKRFSRNERKKLDEEQSDIFGINKVPNESLIKKDE
ncbi:MAG: hypothetical protein O2904_02680 [bacterium]|nr:hypothetical protein [bacterium]